MANTFKSDVKANVVTDALSARVATMMRKERVGAHHHPRTTVLMTRMASQCTNILVCRRSTVKKSASRTAKMVPSGTTNLEDVSVLNTLITSLPVTRDSVSVLLMLPGTPSTRCAVVRLD